jgi:predicted dehydrogenase
MKGAILGVGNVAVNGHVPGWRARPDVEIVGAADVRKEGRTALAQCLPGARWYDSMDALLAAEKLDFVDICTPPALHSSAIRLALEAGVHVLCEKPLVLSSADLASLAALARERALVLATVHNWRHAPVLLRATELVRSGDIGSVSRVRWETLRDKPAAASGQADNWRVDPAVAGGGILVDHGWHALYAIQQWIQGEPDRISARLETRRHREWAIEDTAEVVFHYPAARAEIFLTWTAGERANHVTLEGSAGTITIDGATLEFRPASGRPPRREELPGRLSEGSHHPEWFRGVVEEFLGEIRDPGRRGQSLAEAQRCLRWIETAYESGRRRGEGLPVAESSVEPVFGAAS